MDIILQQECIPVGCVPEGSPPGTPLDQAPPGTRHPPVDKHTPVNILPCPKLRLRSVIMMEKGNQNR